MKPSVAILAVLGTIAFGGSLVFANPALLPKHPGYPASRDTSPVTGQALANDPGQLNLSMEESSLGAASSEDAHVSQRLQARDQERVIDRSGAGLLPKVEGPQTLNKAPVSEGTRLPDSLQGKGVDR